MDPSPQHPNELLEFKKPLSKIENVVDVQRGQKRRISALETREKIESVIPTLKNSSLKTQEDNEHNPLNLNHINKLMGMNEQLTRRKSENEPFDFVTPPKQSDMADKELDFQNERMVSLTEELKQALEKLELLEDDLRYLKRNNHKLNSQILEMNNLIIISKRRFDNLEVSITQNVMNKENMINFKIQEFKQKLKSQLDDFKFEMKTQLNLAKEYKDEDIGAVISKLTQEKADINAEIATLKTKKIKAVQEAIDGLVTQFEEALRHKKDETSRLSDSYKQKERYLEELHAKYLDLSTQISKILKDNEDVEQLITVLQNTSSDFFSIKNNLMSKITTLELKKERLDKLDEEYSGKLKKTTDIYDDISEKFKSQKNTALLLENSIFNLEGSNRIYVNVPSTDKFADNCIKLGDTTFFFNKILSTALNAELVEELKYFVSSQLKASTDFSIVISGTPKANLLVDIILHVYDSVSHSNIGVSYSCKGVGIKDNKFYDMFDSFNILSSTNFRGGNFPSQTMILDEPTNFQTILKKSSESFQGPLCFNITETTSNKPNGLNIKILDVSYLKIQEQADTIQHSFNTLNGLITDCFNSKCFNLCHLNNLQGTSPLLSALESLKE